MHSGATIRQMKFASYAFGPLAAALTFAGSVVASAQQAGSATRSLADMSLEELSQIEVYSATRRIEPTQGIANAVFVLTGEDIHRSGVTSIPDALRLVPGVQVGRVDANKWAVSMRGFNGRGANKLLVLVDGRSIYDPLFSGMLWESQDFLLEDIERIEVIRGPGGTLWGANAFNGVINIITKSAADTGGMLVSVAAGDEERYIAGLRHGWRSGENHHARVYVKARERDTGFLAADEPFDALEDVRGGFRWDWSDGFGDRVRVSGDVYEADAGVRESPVLAHTVDHGGYNLLTEWSRQRSLESDWRLQFYYDHVDYESVGFTQDRDTYDLEFQHNVQVGGRHNLVWGVGYRRLHDHTVTSLPGFVDVLPASRDDEIRTVFLQDDIQILPDALQLVLGLKYEDTDYAASRWLPNLRLSWTPDDQQTWWAGLAEATRVPSRLEADLTFLGTIRIGERVGAEKVRAYEAGHRRLLSQTLWYDAAIFYNDYDDLRTTEGDATLGNRMHGSTRGFELAMRWEPAQQVRLHASYTWLDADLSLDPQSTADPGVPGFHEGLTPRHQFALRTLLELPRKVSADATLRYVDELRALDVPEYTQLDLAVHWRPAGEWELSVVGANLLDPHQPEQGFPFSANGVPTETERSVYARVVWRR